MQRWLGFGSTGASGQEQSQTNQKTEQKGKKSSKKQKIGKEVEAIEDAFACDEPEQPKQQ